MHVVTGGAGFIGSNIVARLSSEGKEVAVCDWLTSDQRWRNLAKHEITALIAPPQLLEWLQRHAEDVEAVIHMGAISDTTESNVDRLAESNVRATLDLLEWCTVAQKPLIYASSAATYGAGEAGFDDELNPDALEKLRPLNAYGWSKHVVDRRHARLVSAGKTLPPQLVGLKFFNVYGPNEYHKGHMRSVIARNFAEVFEGQPLRLFRSYRPDYPDGGQLRDFIYVKDCVDVVQWLLQHPRVSGLFNVGTGRSRSWQDLAKALFAALGRRPLIEYIDMPPELIPKYQYLTEAKMGRLRAAGYAAPMTELEPGVSSYVKDFLSRPDSYL